MKHVDEEKMLRKLAVQHAVKLRARIQNLKARMREATDRASKMYQELQESWKNSDILKNRAIAELDHSLKSAVGQIENLQFAVKALDEERTQLKNLVDNIMAANSQLIESESRLTDQVTTLKSDKESAQAEVVELRRRNENQHKTIAQIQSDMNTINVGNQNAHAARIRDYVELGRYLKDLGLDIDNITSEIRKRRDSDSKTPANLADMGKGEGQ